VKEENGAVNQSRKDVKTAEFPAFYMGIVQADFA